MADNFLKGKNMARSEAVKQMSKLTILLPGGIIPPAILARVSDLLERFEFGLYVSTAQNLRLVNIAEEDLAVIKEELAAAGASFKGPGLFPMAKVCIGATSCNLGIVDTIEISRKIAERFGDRTNVKPKFKIAVSGCPAACSGAMLADIGVVATRAGFDLYVGGKGGPRPAAGKRIKKGSDLAGVLDTIESLVDFHQQNTGKKQRFAKLIEADNFPFSFI